MRMHPTSPPGENAEEQTPLRLVFIPIRLAKIRKLQRVREHRLSVTLGKHKMSRLQPSEALQQNRSKFYLATIGPQISTSRKLFYR